MNYLRKGCMLLMAGILAASGTFGTIQARPRKIHRSMGSKSAEKALPDMKQAWP